MFKSGNLWNIQCFDFQTPSFNIYLPYDPIANTISLPKIGIKFEKMYVNLQQGSSESR